jgi:hypothetical protein
VKGQPKGQGSAERRSPLRAVEQGDEDQQSQKPSFCSTVSSQPGPVPFNSMSNDSQQTARSASIDRKTNETDISVKVNLDSKMDQQIDVATGIGFLDHV